MMPINYLAVLAVSIINMLLGWLWYGFLFAKTRIRLHGFTSKDLEKAKEKGMRKTYLISFISTIIMVLVLSLLLNLTGAARISQGLMLGFAVWLGFIATTTLGPVLWEGKSFKLYLLNNAYNLLSLLLMSVVLVLWR